jgi:hypothetical protein
MVSRADLNMAVSRFQHGIQPVSTWHSTGFNMAFNRFQHGIQPVSICTSPPQVGLGPLAHVLQDVPQL